MFGGASLYLLTGSDPKAAVNCLRENHVLPVAKFAVAAPVVYHLMTGVRHLVVSRGVHARACDVRLCVCVCVVSTGVGPLEAALIEGCYDRQHLHCRRDGGAGGWYFCH